MVATHKLLMRVVCVRSESSSWSAERRRKIKSLDKQLLTETITNLASLRLCK